MSPLSRTPLRTKVEAIPKRNRYIDDEEIKDLIINALKSGQFTTKELVDKVTETLGIDEAPLRARVGEIIRRLERDGVIIRAGTTKGRKIIWALKA
jgi:DNA-directed RNA polymerase delta subunit